MPPTVPRFRFPLGYDPCNPNTVSQEQQKLLFIRPWNRFEATCINRNGNFTTRQLEMRAKAEILQYKRKHIRYTKAEKYALASRKNHAKKHYLPKAHIDENGNLVPAKNTTINNGVVFFNENCNITVSKSSASDVPGPSVNLLLDPAVPLVNFENPRRVYRVGGTYNVNNTIFNQINDPTL